MNCTQWEERVALYAGGDLDPEETVAVQRHLADCPDCRLFASGLSESLDLLRDVHSESIAPAHFAAVRARVLAELGSEQPPWWKHLWLPALVAAALVLVFLFLPSRHSAVPVMPRAPIVAQVAPHVPAPVVLPPPAKAPIHRVRPVRPRPRLAAHIGNGPPIVVKLVTDDPDVVIYWITNKSGE